jgi:hypothetical protein
MLTLIGYCITIMPYGMVFWSESPIKEYFEQGINVLFMIDVGLNFITPYYDQNSVVHYKLSEIAKHYLTGFFLPDTLSCVPFDLLFGGGDESNKLIRMAKIPRLIKMMRIHRIIKSQNIFAGSRFRVYFRLNMAFYKIVILGLVSTIGMHLSTCLWCGIGRMEG